MILGRGVAVGSTAAEQVSWVHVHVWLEIFVLFVRLVSFYVIFSYSDFRCNLVLLLLLRVRVSGCGVGSGYSRVWQKLSKPVIPKIVKLLFTTVTSHGWLTTVLTLLSTTIRLPMFGRKLQRNRLKVIHKNKIKQNKQAINEPLSVAGRSSLRSIFSSNDLCTARWRKIKKNCLHSIFRVNMDSAADHDKKKDNIIEPGKTVLVKNIHSLVAIHHIFELFFQVS